MLQALVKFSSSTAAAWLALACLLLALRLLCRQERQAGRFSKLCPTQVVIQTECPGLSPEQVEALVTRPIETLVNGLGDMESLRSESIQGLSIITAVFKEAPTCSAPASCWRRNWPKPPAPCRSRSRRPA